MNIASVLRLGDAATVLAEGTPALLASLGGVPDVVLAFSSTRQPLADVINGLVALWPAALVMGCSTAGEFTGDGDAKGSTVLWAMRGGVVGFAGFAPRLAEDPETAVRMAAQGLPLTVAGYPHRTAIVLLDALAGVSEEATLLVADALGGDVRLAGGAAGDDLAMKSPLVAVGGIGGGIGSNAIALAVLFTKEAPGVGVCHGHRSLSGPHTVTRASGGTVFEVDGRPAWDVWKEETAVAAGLRGLDPEHLSDDAVIGYLLQFEAGLDMGDGVDGNAKIRAPLARGVDGSLSFACGMPEGAVFRITESVAARQIESAREAARRARNQLGGADVVGAVVFDCICRNLILGNQFIDAVRGIADELGGVPLAGFESYGEVALDAGDMSGFHNTTTVVLAFGRQPT